MTYFSLVNARLLLWPSRSTDGGDKMEKPEEEDGDLSVAASGRHFNIGMLYDNRTDKMIEGITLWDKATLEKTTVERLTKTEFNMECSDSRYNKTSGKGGEISVDIPVYKIVNIGGGGKYKRSDGNSKNDQSINFHYKCFTRKESMTMEQLSKVDHPSVLDQCVATHVVTSILYGGEATLKLERKHSSSDIDVNSEFNIHAICEKIPFYKIKGEMIVNMTEDNRKIADKITCTYKGDFELPKNPSNFLDAVKIYHDFPKLIGTETNVPVEIKLCSLTWIESKTNMLGRKICDDIVSEMKSFFDKMDTLKNECIDILQSDVALIFPDLRCQMQEFENMIKTYKIGIQKVWLSIEQKGGRHEKRCMGNLLEKVYQSTVCILASFWLQTKKSQIKFLEQYISGMDGVNCATDVMSPDKKYTLCLTMSMPSYQSQLEAMKQYSQYPNITETSDCKVTAQQINSTPMMAADGGFKDFYEDNKNNKGIAFRMTPRFSKCYECNVRCYKYDILISDDFKLPPPLEKVEALADETTHKSVTISWSPSKYDASPLTCYVVSYTKATQQATSSVSVDCHKTQVTITDLKDNTEYEVRVWGKYEVGDGPVGDTKVMVKTKPDCQPKMFSALRVSPTEIRLMWQPSPRVANGCCVGQYIIKQETNIGHWEEILRIPLSESSCKVVILPNTVTRFKVTAFYDSDGLTCDSEPCTIHEHLKYICARSDLIQDNPAIYSPKLKLISNHSDDMIDIYEFGERKFDVQEKVILLVGETGSGKSTLINSFVNYIFGVEWEDPFRFKMVLEPNEVNQTMSQTTKITSYTLHHQVGFRAPYTLTIIDTPGFGDGGDIKRNKEITESIYKLFSASPKNYITHIDAVAFVASSSQSTLTPTQNYIFKNIFSVCDKDIHDNVFLLLTFADCNNPQVLSAIQKAKIPYKKSFKFNNCALYALHHDENTSQASDSNEEHDRTFYTMYWEMGVKGFRLFLDQLKHVQSKSIVLTQNVLEEMHKLVSYVVGKQENICLEIRRLKRLDNKIDDCHNSNVNDLSSLSVFFPFLQQSKRSHDETQLNEYFETKQEVNDLKYMILEMKRPISRSLKRLQEMARRPKPLTTVQYLDFIIDNVTNQAEPGWQDTLQQLNTLRKRAECIEKKADEDFDPFH